MVQIHVQHGAMGSHGTSRKFVSKYEPNWWFAETVADTMTACKPRTIQVCSEKNLADWQLWSWNLYGAYHATALLWRGFWHSTPDHQWTWTESNLQRFPQLFFEYFWLIFGDLPGYTKNTYQVRISTYRVRTGYVPQNPPVQRMYFTENSIMPATWLLRLAMSSSQSPF